MEACCIITELEEQAVLSQMIENDSSFFPPISQSLDIRQYANKLSTHARFVMCSKDGTYVGMIAFYTNHQEDQIYIPYLHVSPRFRRQGMAEYMLTYLENNITGYESLALEVRKENKAAYGLYLKKLFNVVEEREEKYLMVKNRINQSL